MQPGNPMDGVPPPADPNEGAAPEILRPSWMDPLYAIAVSQLGAPNFVTLPADGLFTIPANAQRFALFVTPRAGTFMLLVSPHGNAALFPFWSWSASVEARVATLLTHGPTVCAEWTVFGPAGAEFCWQEVVLF